MKSLNFCYWLQGYFEVLAAGGDPEAELTPEQVACIKDHLAMVLTKQTPVRGKVAKAVKTVPPEELSPFKIDIDPFTQPGVTCAGDEQKLVQIDWVTPPVNPNQVRLDIEAEVKKGLEPAKPRVGVEYWVGRDTVPRTRTYCAIGHDWSSQKIC